jgi:putative SOS response-associated peptidase YedK
MSRIHTIMASAADIAAHFGAEAAGDLVVPSETTEGLPGLVVFERDGQRHLRSLTWGFPRIARGEEPTKLGLVADLTNPMWDKIVVEPRYRCLIVLTHFGNPDGEPGEKTRTWFSIDKQPIVAWAGFCRNTPEFGPVYAGMTMEANAAISPTNDRMPVILEPHEYDRWLRGTIQDVIGFQYGKPIAAERMVVERTEDRWRSLGLPSRPGPQLALL